MVAVAAERISQFLSEGSAEDYVEHTATRTAPENYVEHIGTSTPGSKEAAVEVRSGSFSWESAPSQILWDPKAAKTTQFGDRKHAKEMRRKAEELAFQRKAAGSAGGVGGGARAVLLEIDLRVETGALCCVIGKVGSGKSALLHSVLGEMLKLDGSVSVAGSVSYASQSAFILNATVKDNILFSSEFNQERYLKVVKGCCLVSDLNLLPEGEQSDTICQRPMHPSKRLFAGGLPLWMMQSGDATEIGERGVNLSGGQRQRLALARALYRSADVYLLDDPLSAVDSHVGRQIMDFIIDWLKEKTVIMPCHQLHFLHHADLIVTLEDCTIAEQGTFADLMASDGKFSELMHTQGASSNADDASSDADPDLGMTPRPADGSTQTDSDVLAALKGVGKGISGGLIEDEERKTGMLTRNLQLLVRSACL